MASGFRFDPPQVELSSELGWVLARAFGPPSRTLHRLDELRGERVVELAESLDLAERIAARTAEAILIEDVGEAATAAFHRARTGCVARALVVNEVCRELAEVAADLNVPAILLKGAALQLGGWTEPGSRSMGDVDVLIPTDSANTYEEALIDLGCRSPKAPVSEHQLQLLAHPTGLGLEVHTRVRGVRMTGGRSATAEDLLERELCHPLEGLARGCSIPSRMVLIAHALVHGIAQHGLAPDSYPWSRFLADLQDLKVDRASWPETAAAVLPWLQRDVSADEMTAAVELVDRLACGEDAQAIVACEGRPAVLLQHLVGGVDDDEYVRLMRLERRSSGLSDHPRWMRIARSVKRNLWLSRAGVERRYGQPKNELGYLVRRLWRPLDLASETIGDGWAWMRHRLRRR